MYNDSYSHKNKTVKILLKKGTKGIKMAKLAYELVVTDNEQILAVDNLLA